jgi:hypothetical protein
MKNITLSEDLLQEVIENLETSIKDLKVVDSLMNTNFRSITYRLQNALEAIQLNTETEEDEEDASEYYDDDDYSTGAFGFVLDSEDSSFQDLKAFHKEYVDRLKGLYNLPIARVRFERRKNCVATVRLYEAMTETKNKQKSNVTLNIDRDINNELNCANLPYIATVEQNGTDMYIRYADARLISY